MDGDVRTVHIDALSLRVTVVFRELTTSLFTRKLRRGSARLLIGIGVNKYDNEKEERGRGRTVIQKGWKRRKGMSSCKT